MNLDGFSLVNARACVEASAEAYRQETFSTELAHVLVKDVVITGNSQSAIANSQEPIANSQGLVTSSPTEDRGQRTEDGGLLTSSPTGRVTVVAFRGSASARDWFTDLQCLRTKTAAGEEIHHGFLDAIINVSEKLTRWWGRPVPGTPVIVTGHSLGAALAVLGAQVLVKAGFPVHSVYTFGGPRVGNGVWARGYDGMRTDGGGQKTDGNSQSAIADSQGLLTSSPTGLLTSSPTLGKRTFRFVDEEDIVPRVPFWHWGYRHVGQECFMPAIGGMRLNPAFLFKASSDVIGTWLDWRAGRVGQLADHSVVSYQQRVWKISEAAAGAVNSGGAA